MWNNLRFLVCVGIVFCTGFGQNAHATHIVGGNITYDFISTSGQGTTYKIRVEIYQDCLNGIPEARADDIPAYIGIFSEDGAYKRLDSIGDYLGGSVKNVFVRPNFSNDCVNNPPQVCLRRITFEKNYTLPLNSSGFKVIYIRCCRNEAIVNLNNPGQVGATYFCRIPPSAEAPRNSSAYFDRSGDLSKYPPQIICVNNPLVFDHSAMDDDGDSLSYELCTVYPGGMTTAPKPFPTGQVPPPITQVGNQPPSYGYAQGFTPERPMGGNPVIQIDPKTGLITGTPNLQGRFVVGVCVHEWRNGVLINTVSREFQYTVTNCSKKVIADIPQFSDEFNTYLVSCKSKEVTFVNNSIGGFDYTWSFGTGDSSNEFQPTYTYPDTGTYEVHLLVNENSTCPDSITRLVKVYPDFSTDYSFEGLSCPNSPVMFMDLTQATYKPVVEWRWDFGDGNTSSRQNPVHVYEAGGDYPVTLISKSIKGCVDTFTKSLAVENFKPSAGNDTIIVKGEVVDFNARGGIVYEWTPPTNLNTTTIGNPRGYYPDTGMFKYNVYIKSAAGCEGNDSIDVWVVNQPALFVPTGFTPNGDGKNDLLRPISIGYQTFNYFRVFNRWGELVFETDQIGDGWNGKYRGLKADIGTYFWILDAVDKDGVPHQQKGDATLIR